MSPSDRVRDHINGIWRQAFMALGVWAYATMPPDSRWGLWAIIGILTTYHVLSALRCRSMAKKETAPDVPRSS